jgi:putative tryptophan/tyrosine transport system substrate-binding protein
MIQRREFITLLGGAAAGWPIAARAQATMPVIGFLDTRSPEAMVDRLRAWRQGLQDTGHVEGENVSIVYRWADGHFDRLQDLAADLVRRQVTVIATGGGIAPAQAAKTATTTIPIVFAVPEDPVGVGLVASLARPGGNLTGVNFFTTELAAKRLGLLHEMMPGARDVGVLVNPANPNTQPTLHDVEVAARSTGMQIRVLYASTGREIDVAFASLVRDRPDALFVGGDSFFLSRRLQLVTLTVRHAIPAIFSQRDYTEVGGLMSYASDTLDAYQQSGAYVGRILKGAKPGELPVLQSTRFKLVINNQTAKAFGLEVPPTLLARADEVIE